MVLTAWASGRAMRAIVGALLSVVYAASSAAFTQIPYIPRNSSQKRGVCILRAAGEVGRRPNIELLQEYATREVQWVGAGCESSQPLRFAANGSSQKPGVCTLRTATGEVGRRPNIELLQQASNDCERGQTLRFAANTNSISPRSSIIRKPLESASISNLVSTREQKDDAEEQGQVVLSRRATVHVSSLQREKGGHRQRKDLYELWQFAVRSRDIIAEGRD